MPRAVFLDAEDLELHETVTTTEEPQQALKRFERFRVTFIDSEDPSLETTITKYRDDAQHLSTASVCSSPASSLYVIALSSPAIATGQKTQTAKGENIETHLDMFNADYGEELADFVLPEPAMQSRYAHELGAVLEAPITTPSTPTATLDSGLSDPTLPEPAVNSPYKWENRLVLEPLSNPPTPDTTLMLATMTRRTGGVDPWEIGAVR